MNKISETVNGLYGVGFRSPHYEWVTTRQPRETEIFEIVSDNFMAVGGRPRFYLEKLRRDYPVLMHGVGLSLGSKRTLDDTYLRELKELTSWLEPAMVSDHLSWGHFEQYNSHDLLPIVYTQESLRELTDKLNAIQDYLGRRFFLENPSAYVSFRAGDYSEADFFSELLERTGAGILLDVNNLYVNHRNLGRDPEDFLRALRPEHIGYFHLAGHSDQGDVLVDTHDQPVTQAVWDLYAKAKAYFPGKPAIIEWDGNIPEFPVLLQECVKAREIPADGGILSSECRPMLSEFSSVDEKAIHRDFFAELMRPYGLSEEATRDLDRNLPTPADVGLKVYNHAFFSRLEEVLKENFTALAFVLGEKGFRHLVADYLTARPPVGSGLEAVGQGLVLYLEDESTGLGFDFGVSKTVLSDLAKLEWAQCEVSTAPDTLGFQPSDLENFSPDDWETKRFVFSEHVKLVRCAYDVLPVLRAVQSGERPAKPEARDVAYWVYREGFELVEREADEDEALAWEILGSAPTFLQVAEGFAESKGFFEAELLNRVAQLFMSWSHLGFLRPANAN